MRSELGLGYLEAGNEAHSHHSEHGADPAVRQIFGVSLERSKEENAYHYRYEISENVSFQQP